MLNRKAVLQTVCENGFDLGLVPLSELDNGPGREGGKHGDYVPASTRSAPGLKMAFIEAARPFEELVGGLGGVERRLAHRAVVLGLEARFGARGDDDAWREFSQLHNLLSFANTFFFARNLAYLKILVPNFVACGFGLKATIRARLNLCNCWGAGHEVASVLVLMSISALIPASCYFRRVLCLYRFTSFLRCMILSP